MRAIRAVPTLLTTLLVAACGTGYQTADHGAMPPSGMMAASSAVVGTWQLVQVNGQPLPVFTGAYDNCREYVVSGTMTLMADGTYRAMPMMRDICTDREESTREAEPEMGTYTVSGTTIRFNEEAIERPGWNRWENASGNGQEIPIEDLGGTGTLQGDVLQVRLSDDRSVVTFRR